MKSSLPIRRLLKLKDAAQYLGLSLCTVRAIVQRGELPFISPTENGKWLLDMKDLDQWIEQRKQRSF